MTIAEFLVKAVLDPDKYEDFWNPATRDAFFEERKDLGLTEHQIRVLKNPDLTRVRIEISAEFNILGEEGTVVYSTVHVTVH